MASTGEALLVIEGGPDDGESIPLTGSTVTLGRDLDSVVVVSDKGVSRRHAALVKSKTGYDLRDLSSTNGTFVNGQRFGVEDHRLKDSDTIRLGASKATFTYHSPTAETLLLTLEPPTEESPTDTVDAVEPLREAAQEATSEEPQSVGDGNVDDGTVRLRVKSAGNMGLLIGFVHQLGENPDCKILRLAGDAKKSGVEAWLFLRKPVSLREWLDEMEGVIQVSATRGRDLRPESGDNPLTVVPTAVDEDSGEE